MFFRLLLSLYPREFRDEYGREMALLFKDRWRYEAGFWQRFRLIFEAVEGAAISAPQEHTQIFLTDLRYASRSLRNSPLITPAIVITVAFAAGANATMLSLLDQLLLQPIPGVTEPDRVVRV